MAEIRLNHTPLSSIIIDDIEKHKMAFERLARSFKSFSDTTNKIIMEEEKKMTNKFKVGDMVIGNDKADRIYNVTTKGWIGRVIENKVWDMCGRIRVESLKSDGSYSVNPDCFDLYIPHEGKVLIMVDEKDPNKIVARDLITKKIAEAKCNPKDEWDFSKGAKLALERLYPEKKEEEKPKYWSGKVVCVEFKPYVFHQFFTVGKVYEVKDGTLYDDKPPVPYMGCIESIDQLNSRVTHAYRFVEFKGEA